jgi:hypothetical protein
MLPMIEDTYWEEVQSDPAVREAEHVFDRISELTKENEVILRDLHDISARSRVVCAELTRLIDRLDRLRAGVSATPTMLQ